MPEPTPNFWTWARHHLLLSNSRQAWEDRLAVLVLLLGGGALFFFASELPLSRQILLWGLLFVVLAVLLRQGWLRLFGPVLFYDLMRVSRRGRYFLMRLLYILGLSLLISQFYWAYWVRRQMGDGTISLKVQAEFAEAFFYTFMWVQFLAVVVLTPAYTASAVADEKDRKTLEFLLATDLHNREIILGKWLARVGNLALLILGGVPILALNLFMGGVDPDLMVAGFVATGLTMVSLAGVSILASVYGRRARDAIVLSYLLVVTYYAFSTMLSILAIMFPAFGGQGVYLGAWSLTVQDVAYWLGAGNIFVVLFNLAKSVALGGGLVNVLPTLLREYAIFHVLLTGLTVGLAIARLRVVAISQQAVTAIKRGPQVRQRRGVGHYPAMIWKEVFADPGARFNLAGRVVLLLLVALSFTPLFIIVYFFLDPTSGWSGNWEGFSRGINAWTAVVGMLVGCLTLLGVGVRAAASISGERDKQTFDSLLTTPLGSNEILWSKWLGSLTSQRWGFIWVCLIWGLGVVLTGLNPLLAILLVAAWVVYAAVIALIGLWFSMASKTTLRATMWTVVTTIACSLGHWVLWSCCIPFLMFAERSGEVAKDFFEVVLKVEMGLSPPITLYGMLPWRTDDILNPPTWQPREFRPLTMIGYALFGLAVWAAAGALLWVTISKRFQQLTGREPRRPEGLPPRRRPETAAAVRTGGGGQPATSLTRPDSGSGTIADST